MRDVEIETLRNRIARLAAEGREAEREATAWLLADLVMRGPKGRDPGRRMVASSSNLRCGCTSSCGCLKSEIVAARNRARACPGGLMSVRGVLLEAHSGRQLFRFEEAV